ncbi:MAG: hypothetical protein P1U46_02060 [Patescibacteria group bacterium]|nr:hypothetical protein [Patescibacteria group bacterium]
MIYIDIKDSFCLAILSILIFFFVIISQRYHSVTIESISFSFNIVDSSINLAFSFIKDVFHNSILFSFAKFIMLFSELSTILSFKSLQNTFLLPIRIDSIRRVPNQTKGSYIFLPSDIFIII